MMRIKSVSASDFMSFKELSYDFGNEPVRINGLNLTDQNQESNGSGKSVFQNIIEFAILSSNSRKARDKDLIRIGASKAFVSVTIGCEIRGYSLRIERTIQKSGSKLGLFKVTDSGEEPVLFSTAKDGNEFILDWLAMRPSDITSYFIINNERFKSLFSSSNTERMSLISRFVDMTDVNNAIANITLSTKEVEDIRSNLEKNRTMCLGVIESLEARIKRLSESINEDDGVAAEIDRFNRVNDGYRESIRKLAESSKNVLENIDSLKAEESKTILDIDELEKLYDKDYFDEIVKIMAEVESEISTLKREVGLKESLLKTSSCECPNCKHTFIINNGKSVQDMVAEIEADNKRLAGLRDDLCISEGEYLTEKAKKDKILELKKTLDRIKFGISEESKNLSDINRKIDNLNDSIDMNTKKMDDFVMRKKPDVSHEIESVKAELAKELKNAESMLSELSSFDDMLFELGQWKQNFSKFKMFLSNMVIGTIEDRCNMFLKKINSDLTVKISGHKLLASGEYKEEITLKVVREEEADFHSYSGGEKGRVQFAMILAIQEMINETNPYGGLAFISMDEIFEGVDGLGLKHLMESISGIGQTVLVTTHITDEHITNSNTITFVKKDGVSSIMN